MADPRPAVLVVDDEPINRSLIRASLGATCEVVEAGSGPEALAILAERSVDIVLLDVMMPLMSGYEVCKRIKDEQRENLPVLLVTALGEQEDKNRGLHPVPPHSPPPPPHPPHPPLPPRPSSV